jgi:hypothetical protein
LIDVIVTRDTRHELGRGNPGVSPLMVATTRIVTSTRVRVHDGTSRRGTEGNCVFVERARAKVKEKVIA